MTDSMDVEPEPRSAVDSIGAPQPARSVEGWVLMITGVHEEAQDEDIYEPFSEMGDIKNLHLNLDRQTGFVKGYAVVEYDGYEEAAEAVARMNGVEILGKQIHVGFAFASGPLPQHQRGRR